MAEYIVHTKGEVARTDEERHTYIITANSSAEAKLLAKNIFSEEYGSNPENIFASSSMVNRNLKGWTAVALLSIAILLSFREWFVGNATEPITFKPDMIGGIYATLLYGAYIVRFKGVQELFNSILDIALLVVNIVTLAGIINMLLLTDRFSVLGISFPIDTKYVLLLAIFISWIGLKSISGFCLIGVILLGMLKLVTINTAMGIWGIIYVLSVALGIGLYSSIEPSIIDAVPFLYQSFEKQRNWVKNDISSFKNSTTSLGNQLIKKSRKEKEKAKNENNFHN